MKLPHLRSRNIALLMLVASVILYGLDYLIFGRRAEIASGFLGNLAFLPVYVLFVTLMLERVFKERERLAIRQKMNMVIGVFFSEVGTGLLADLSFFVQDGKEVTDRLKVNPNWSNRDFAGAYEFLACHEMHIDSRKGDLARLKILLAGNRGFMLRLLENPNLLEHDEFTDLLWAVFHLVEELEARKSLDGLPPADMEHLSGDIRRAYGLLFREWLVYMRHLKHDYPYLFSLAVRTNPMDPEARVEVV